MKPGKVTDCYAKGTLVLHPRFRTTLVIVDGPDRDGRYLIEHGSLTVWLPGIELKIAPKKTKKSNPPAGPTVKTKVAEQPTRTLDLHGLSVEDAISALEREIDRGLISNTIKIEIVHGLGTGKVKEAVHLYLAQCHHISRFELDMVNPGVTLVYL